MQAESARRTFLVCVCLLANWPQFTNGEKRRVILMSFDGFRWDYVNHFNTPNLNSFKEDGVYAPEGITPAFVTKTYPCHYTMATGLHAESHGIINNVMYDPTFKSSFSYDTDETRWWNGARPVWTTATLAGLKVGTYFWPGTSVQLEGVRPYRWKTYEANAQPKTGVDTVMNWLLDDDMDFIMVYFSEPDSSGHKFGALSLNVGQAVRQMDEVMGNLTSRLRSTNLYDYTDIILVSDHGMTNVTADDDHVIVLEDFLDVKENILAIPDEGALVNILPRPGKENYVFQKLHGAHSHMTVRWKQDIPNRLHYKNNRRILPIVLFPDEGYFITKSRPYKFDVGQHGYDNLLPSMRPIFFARGPSFRQGVQVSSSYQSVNVYPLLCHLLGIRPSPNNGTLQASRDMLWEIASPFSVDHMSKAHCFPPPSLLTVIVIFITIVFLK